MVTLEDKILLLIKLSHNNWGSTGSKESIPESFILDSFSRGYKKTTLRQRIWEMVKRSLIKRIKQEGSGLIELTETGDVYLQSNIPLFKKSQEWDGHWRVVIFDIEKARGHLRDSLRRQLISNGFRNWQRSFWVTPHDINPNFERFVLEKELKGAVEILIARRFWGEDDIILAEKLWNLSTLNNSYLSLCNEWQAANTQYSMNLDVLKKIAVSLQDRFLDIYWSDPGLPTKLLPGNWAFDNAYSIHSSLVRAIY